MTLLLISFIAGILTVLAPCILPLLPIVIGRSVEGGSKYKPLVVSASLAIAVIVFTLLLKASTVLIDIPPDVWKYISGGIIILFGLVSLFPTTWEKVSIRLGFSKGSNELLGKTAQKKGFKGDILLGLALGPVFSSCSPTYFLILATVLPQSYAVGIVYLTAYALGLALMLLLIGYLGQKLVKRLNVVADPHGWFKRGLGILFILVGIFIMTGADKKVQTYVIEKGIFDITQVEQKLLADPMEENFNKTDDDDDMSKKNYPKYKEIVNPAGFVNADSVSLDELVGEKVILLDFMTYSCINCQRTFPYLNAWYDKYKDAGLEVIGIHTPEFAFEHKKENVEEAAEEFGLKFPLVLDNDYATWKAYGNRYWPRKYLIDIDGNIVYDHIGEGAYDVTEKKIQELLAERAKRREENMMIDAGITLLQDAEHVDFRMVKSPETYFGSLRQDMWGVEAARSGDVVTFQEPNTVRSNQLYLVGDWKITDEYAEAVSTDAKIIFKYNAKKVFLVMLADDAVDATILQDGKVVGAAAGEHVQNGVVTVQNEQLYRLIENEQAGEHVLEIQVNEPGLQAFAFTFG